MRAHLAHAGVVTAPSAGAEAFQAFCDRQRSRVANHARSAHRRYVGRVLRLLERDAVDVTVRGYGIGGGPSRAHSSDE